MEEGSRELSKLVSAKTREQKKTIDEIEKAPCGNWKQPAQERTRAHVRFGRKRRHEIEWGGPSGGMKKRRKRYKNGFVPANLLNGGTPDAATKRLFPAEKKKEKPE